MFLLKQQFLCIQSCPVHLHVLTWSLGCTARDAEARTASASRGALFFGPPPRSRPGNFSFRGRGVPWPEEPRRSSSGE
eukprot:9200463-Pyramimonas_sp.AAC.1